MDAKKSMLEGARKIKYLFYRTLSIFVIGDFIFAFTSIIACQKEIWVTGCLLTQHQYYISPLYNSSSQVTKTVYVR